jgi:hypothetical protein
MHALGPSYEPFIVSLQGCYLFVQECISILFADTQAF